MFVYYKLIFLVLRFHPGEHLRRQLRGHRDLRDLLAPPPGSRLHHQAADEQEVHLPHPHPVYPRHRRNAYDLVRLG